MTYIGHVTVVDIEREEQLQRVIHAAPLALIAARVRRGRRLASLTQVELAEVVGISPRQVIRYEKGESRPSATTLLRIAEATGRRVEWFTNPDLEPSPFDASARTP